MKKKEEKEKQINVDYEIRTKEKQQQTTHGIRKSQCRTRKRNSVWTKCPNVKIGYRRKSTYDEI